MTFSTINDDLLITKLSAYGFEAHCLKKNKLLNEPFEKNESKWKL